MNINELVEKAHKNAVAKGFWEYYEGLFKDKNLVDKQQVNCAIGNMLMLIVSELGEALEALRKDDWDNFREELADVAIRLGDLCGGLDIDLKAEIIKKMDKNSKRPYKHGKEF